MRIKPLGPLFVFYLFNCMLTTIRFDNDFLLIANKIDNETAKLFLAPEFQAVKLSGLQAAPQDTFSISRVLP